MSDIEIKATLNPECEVVFSNPQDCLLFIAKFGTPEHFSSYAKMLGASGGYNSYLHYKRQNEAYLGMINTLKLTTGESFIDYMKRNGKGLL